MEIFDNQPRDGCVTFFHFMFLQVTLLMTIEIGIFPLIIGWWLDICSLVRKFQVFEVLVLLTQVPNKRGKSRKLWEEWAFILST